MRITMMRKGIAAVLAMAMVASAVPSHAQLATALNLNDSFISAGKLAEASTSAVVVSESAGYAEGAYAQWSAVTNATGYNVYCDGAKIDSMLIRQYATHFRADVVGIKSGSHTLKIVPIIGGNEDASKSAQVQVTSSAHDRSGFAFVNGKAMGAYNADGTLKSGAIVVYVTNANKDTVSVSMDAGSGVTNVTGVQNIITGYKKGKETRPIAIRFIGNVTDPGSMAKGDLLVDTVKAGMTLEGIGNDATCNGFGIVIKNSTNVEVRNLGFMNCNSDEGDNCGLQQGNTYCWVHNCDFFYGDAGSDADQAKGDGALDTKKSQYITHSYNHFWDSGKCNLQGANASDTSNFITYHHNWYDHSDSRHPRVRVATVHVYNNYYDGNSKYGIGSTTDSDVFAESNYFRNCAKPMIISKQGSDTESTLSGEAGGMIKAYGNVVVGATSYKPYSTSASNFDCYDVKSKTEQVPASVKALNGGATYNNFDTASNMYSYTADAAENVPAIVEKNAGRVNGGDFKWTFTDSVDDKSSSVNTALKAALVSYKDSIVAIGSGFSDNTDAPPQTQPPAQTTAPVQTTAPPANTNPPAAAGGYVHDFTANGKDSSFYTISGNLSTSKGSVNYAGKTLTRCLKMETATSISFNAGAGGKLTLVFAEAGKAVKVDGTKYTTDANGIVTVDLAAGAHTITKGDSINLFYMAYASGSGENISTTKAPETNPPAQNTTTTTTLAPDNTQPPAVGPSIPSNAKVIYCSPNGKGSGTSKDDPTDVKSAVAAVPAGGVIYLLGGTYQFSETIMIDQNNSGTENALKTISAYPGETVVWDFTGLGEADPSKRGVVLDGSYWHWYGFEITKAADNGMLLSGNHNTIEMMVFNDNQDTGLQLSRYRTDTNTIAQWPSYNLILNCTSKNNCDNATMENADGFAAKLTCGEGNVFDGCLAYNNSDDGWDLYAKEATGPIGVVTIRNSIAFRNGYTEFGEGYGDCDGNGFKLGGAGVGTAHVVENCLAFENLNCGFTDNNNPKLGSLTNCTAFDNSIGGNGKPNFSLYRCTDDGCDFSKVICYVKNQEGKNDKFVGTIENSAYYNSGKYYYVGGKQAINNGDKIGEIVPLTDNDFISLSVGAMGTDFHKEWRNANGSIYTKGFAQTKESSTYAALGAKFYYSDDQPSTEPPATNPPATEPPTTPSEPTETVTLYGDANCDNKVDILDVITLNKALLGNNGMTKQGEANVDVDNDGKPSANDSLNILKFIVKLVDKLPL
ncbi:MAG: hypothetical protein E7504_04725 [Ruminococcus sp.]|nr:hypothetical protein [Ruminococcus sp.]